MKLDRLIRESLWTEQSLADAVGVNQSTINRLRNDERFASVGLAMRLEQATGGSVKPSDLPMTDVARRSLAALRALASQTSRDAAA